MLPQEIKHLIQRYKDKPLESVVFKKFPENVDVPLLLQQLEGRRFIANKMPSWNTFIDELVFPSHLAFQQASSEQTARYKASLLQIESLVDLTGGMGIDSYFFSQRVKKLVYIEQQSNLCSIASHNFNVLGAQNIDVINTQAEVYSNTMPMVDCVYIDPARRNITGAKVVLLEDCSPNVEAILPHILTKTRYVLLKLSPMFDIEMAVRSLPNIKEIHIVAVDNDCKELLVVLDVLHSLPSCTYHCINIAENNQNQQHSYTNELVQGVHIHYTSQLSTYVYEPNVTILKAGCFSSIATAFCVEKLHPNSHLFTSNQLHIDFPGRIFEVIEVVEFNKKAIKTLLTPIKKANVTVRNFPLRVDEFRKKTQLKEGGDTYIYATTVANNKKVCIICRKINQK